jgi:hypothetical protein
MKIQIQKFLYDLRKNGVTQSMLMEFAACRTRAKLGYLQRWTSEFNSNALTFGSMFHGSLEHVYTHWKKPETPTRKWLTLVAAGEAEKHEEEVRKERHWTEDDEQNKQLNLGYLTILLPEYFRKWWPMDSKRTFIKNEVVFHNTWRGLVTMTGKYDRVFENTNKELWILETKTKSRIEPSLQDRLSFDFQANFYILNLLLELDRFPEGFIYDVVQRPQQRMGKNETLQTFVQRVKDSVSPDYFQRIVVTRTKKEFNEWVIKDFTPLMTEFLYWIEKKLPTYRNPSACETRYGACKFLKVCGLGSYQGLYKRKVLFPELTSGD